MLIDFKKELESASKSMIMIHDPELLIKLIIRMIVRKLKVRHAGMLLYDVDKDCYVLSVSRGKAGERIPQGFTRIGNETPMIKFFSQKKYKQLMGERNGLVLEDINKIIWSENVIEKDRDVTRIMIGLNEQMEMLNASVCVPAYHHNKLLAILLLGKKHDASKFHQEELDFFAALASDAAMAIRNAQLFENLRKEADLNRKQYIQTIVVLGSLIEAKDKYTHGHTERVTQYSLDIARKLGSDGLLDVSEEFFERLYIGALLHDIGKVGVSENILNKKGSLTEEEYAVIKTHPFAGAEIVKPLALPEECISGIKYHHERYDGRGYPQGIASSKIPIEAAIISVADVYDAMITNRPYRKALPKQVSIDFIKGSSNIRFNPMVVNAFLELCESNVL